MLFISILYGFFAFVALLNLLLMRRPGRRAEGPKLAVLIPARNERKNLLRLIPTLRDQGLPVFVFDDESDDGTGEVAREAGATVIRPREPLPAGWTGKNRACHELAKAATEASDADWWIFLDADTYPQPGFADGMRDLAATVGLRCPVITGIPRMRPGRGIEPLFLAWVGWIILCTNPFGLVSRTGKGHNRFTNGQVHMWRSTTYISLWPNEQVRANLMEDVMIGRLLAREGIRVETANLTSILEVKMYDHWRETLDGMSKNSYEVANSAWGTCLIALMFLVLSFAWIFAWPLALILFTLSGLLVALIARAAWWPVLFMPAVTLIAAYTMLRSLYWRRTGRATWKGRVYSGS